MDPDAKDKPRLSKAEASAVIDWIDAISQDDLNDLVIEMAMNAKGGGAK